MTRASDAEREEIARLLQAAAGEGRLTPDEAGERLALAAVAKSRDELARLVEDLPAPEPPTLPPSAAARMAFRAGLVVQVVRVGLLAVVLTAFWKLSGARFFWPVFPLTFITLGALARLRFMRRRIWFGSWRGWRRPLYGP